jgi:hypothetical protein
VNVEEYSWGLIVRKPCFPGSFLAVAMIFVVAWISLRGVRDAVAGVGTVIAVLALASTISLPFLECLWSRAEIDLEKREIRFLMFGRLWRSIRFGEIDAIVAKWDPDGFLIPMVLLNNGKVVRFLFTQSTTNRRRAAHIESAVAAIQRAITA